MVAVRTELPAGVITLLLLKGGSTPSPLTAASSREAWAIKPTTFVDGGIDFRRVEAATGFSSSGILHFACRSLSELVQA